MIPPQTVIGKTFAKPLAKGFSSNAFLQSSVSFLLQFINVIGNQL